MPSRTSWKNILAVGILIGTVCLFAYYFATNPDVITQIRQIDGKVLSVLLFLYFVFVSALALVNTASVKLCSASIKFGENLLLTMYSSVINFFGPLQSGPAFRTIYLNKKHSIKVKDYAAASFLYYFFYGLFSIFLLFSGVLGYWLIAIIGALVLAILIIKNSRYRAFKGINSLNVKYWYLMAGATLLQVLLLLVIFGIELKTVDSSISLSQIAIYTGAANLALFVSITPGAIGFREFFLVSTQRLHHIDNATIVAANTIDRAVYVLLLLILAVLIVATHAKSRLSVELFNKSDK